ncbi:MAG: MFS transporter [Phycisphaerae bacterium]|nr:MFS transporter [Phycisphaerae bacterium]
MKRNLVIIVVTAVLFGLAFGIYELILPLWLKRNGISYKQMGWIYAVSNVMMMLVPIVAGWLADHFGRKRFFSASVAACAAACLATPMTASVVAQTGLRLLQRAATGVYQALQEVLIFETNAIQFIVSIRLARGFEYTCHAVAALLVFFLVIGKTSTESLALPMYLAVTMLVIAFVLVVRWLREPREQQTRRLDVKRINPFGLPKVLILLAGFNFLFNAGLSISHSQLQLLFFEDKFDLANSQVAIVAIVHRISLGLPMMLAAFWMTRPRKWLFALTVALEGVFVSATVLPTTVVGAVAVWFLHDPIGAAIWVPMNAWYMQQFARPDHRAADVATVLAMGTLGMAIGPILGGYLAEWPGHVPAPLSGAIDLPFFVSGVIVFFSAALVCFLPRARHVSEAA